MDVPLVGLGDLGLRAEVARALKEWIRATLEAAMGDELGHASAVAAGPVHWREAFLRAVKRDFGEAVGKAADEASLPQLAFDFLVWAWRKAHPGVSAAMWLDHVEVIAPPTAEEIEASWQIEIGSSEAAMEQFWEGGARTRKGAGALGARTEPLKES